MILTVIISAIIFICMICSILLFPKIKIGKSISLDSYWVITLVGVILLVVLGCGSLESVFSALTANSAINPIKILTLFIAMTILSIFLDELGFFSYLAGVTLAHAGRSRKKLFIMLYVTVSILTIFTSNDIIILSFTPFIIYFSKNAKISPLPFLAAEFVAANTWSMALVIGNPTNIYLATAYGIDFITYFEIMILPTILAGVTALLLLLLIFHKNLSRPIAHITTCHICAIKDTTAFIVGIVHLGICTVMLAVASYLNIEMWLISCGAVISLTLIMLIIYCKRKKKPLDLLNAYKKAPYQLIPFVLSMFAIIIILKENEVTSYIASILGNSFPILKYGIASFLSANVINNIPMSVLFTSIIESADPSITLFAVYATIVGSNLGAILTPIGALAGIMWSSILTKHHISFPYKNFVKIGFLVSVPTILVTLGALAIIL